MEYELLDTGVFDERPLLRCLCRVRQEHAEDILIQISACNRGPEPATLHVLPTLWFRNTWTWWPDTPKPSLKQMARTASARRVIGVTHAELGERFLYCEGEAPLLFTENETNNERIFGTPNASPYVKDGINNYVVHGQRDAVNPDAEGTKAARALPGHRRRRGNRRRSGCASAMRRLPTWATVSASNSRRSCRPAELRRTSSIDAITPGGSAEDEARVMRQALAGMLWTQAVLRFRCATSGSRSMASDPTAAGDSHVRNREWFHMVNEHIISMPDKWEYPWYAAWDLAFHTHRALHGGCGFREGAARPAAAGILPASDRSDPGLRVELQRRQSAGARLGHDLPLPDRAGAARARATWSFSSALSRS